MRHFVICATLMTVSFAASSLASAQVTADRPYEIRVTASLSSKPQPANTSCPSLFCNISRRGDVSLAGRLSRLFDVLATVGISDGVTDSLFMVDETSGPRKSYRTTLRSDALVTADVRGRASFGNQRRLEASAGVGIARSPDDMPYAVTAGGIRIGKQHHVRFGVEYRSYWMRYDEQVFSEVNGELGYHRSGSGRGRAGTVALSLSWAQAFAW
jgi:hypothetical protein